MKKKLRRGPRKEQASPQAYEDAGDAVSRGKVAKYGKHYGEELRDLLFATRHCPDSAPALDEITDYRMRGVLLLGWRLLHALCRFNRLDRDFIDRCVAVRGGETFRAMVKGPDRESVDPLRTALAPLGIQYEKEFFSLVSKFPHEPPHSPPPGGFLKPKSVLEVRNWLYNHSYLEFHDDKTLRQACEDMGIPLVGRGRPPAKNKG